MSVDVGGRLPPWGQTECKAVRAGMRHVPVTLHWGVWDCVRSPTGQTGCRDAHADICHALATLNSGAG
eukprot:7924108-Alexandrium_andersonii.AAC.1